MSKEFVNLFDGIFSRISEFRCTQITEKLDLTENNEKQITQPFIHFPTRKQVFVV